VLPKLFWFLEQKIEGTFLYERDKEKGLLVYGHARHHKAVQKLVLSSIPMSANVKKDLYPLFLMSVSLFGLFLVGMLAFNMPVAEEDLLWRKPVIGSIFGSICILGILATLFPKECSGTSHFKKEEIPTNKYNETPQSRFASSSVYPSIRGHHPDCGNFSAHVFQIKNKTFCTSCTGLLLGALITLAGTILYFFNNWQISHESLLVVSFGILGTGFGLLQFPLFKNRRGFLRLFLNAYFVLGTSYILIGIDMLIRSVAIDLFLILLSVFWIFTRISLSQWDHKRICYACNVAKCEFRR